jgi:hypothetical protein
MPRDPLPPDPDSVEKWKQMPQNAPSRNALPPATGGMGQARWLYGLLIVMAVLIILSWLLQQARPA